MEHKVLTENQQKHANTINAQIAQGVMPNVQELRSARGVLSCGCPEHLLRSVVEKNAAIVRSRRSRTAAKPRGTSAAWRAKCARMGVTRHVSFEDQKEIHNLRVKRRRNLFNQV